MSGSKPLTLVYHSNEPTNAYGFSMDDHTSASINNHDGMDSHKKLGHHIILDSRKSSLFDSDSISGIGINMHVQKNEIHKSAISAATCMQIYDWPVAEENLYSDLQLSITIEGYSPVMKVTIVVYSI